MEKPLEGIAIIGLGAVFPKALNREQYWSNIVSGTNSIIEVPADRWDWRLYWDPNPKTPDKTYSKIGGFVQGFQFNSLKYRIPPAIAGQMDSVQQMVVAASEEALQDAGYGPGKLNPERTSVIIGNSLGGVKQSQSDLRVYSSMIRDRLCSRPSFSRLPSEARTAILEEFDLEFKKNLTAITEDSMPGELSNVIAGRVANVFGLQGANFTVDAACASSLAAVDMAVKGLRTGEYDMVICGGADQMMAPPAFVKFSKIGALSPDGSRPFDARANGFVMGEGVGIFLLKRVSDARRDGDRIYAVIRAVGASSDGKGKGITAPNPQGQRLAMERAFKQVDYTPADVQLVEAHGTSTPVGDVVEAGVLQDVFSPYASRAQSVALGSVKSQIGHTKAAAGAASLIKAVLSLHNKKLPPSINFEIPNPQIGFEKSPFFVNTQTRDWVVPSGIVRRANVSSFGFGGTNFHVVLEEETGGSRTVDPLLEQPNPQTVRGFDGADLPMPSVLLGRSSPARSSVLNGAKKPHVLLLGARDEAQMRRLAEDARDRLTTASAAETEQICRDSFGQAAGAEYRVAVVDAEPAQIASKLDTVLEWLKNPKWEKPPVPWRMKGIHAGRSAGNPGKIAFLFPGQGSQYVDMLRDLHGAFDMVRATFEEADRILEPLIGEKLTGVVFSGPGEDEAGRKRREERLKHTSFTQPAVFAADVALLRLLESYGVKPDMVAGHSLGEYAAMVSAGVLSFEDACYAISARAKEMAGLKVDDPGKMASVSLNASRVSELLDGVPGYTAIANKNCLSQTVIAGATDAVRAALAKFSTLGIEAQEIAVSHAFHSAIVAPAQEPYRRVLSRLAIRAPKLRILSNVTADFYPQDPAAIRELLAVHIASPVEFTRQVQRMYEEGVRIFIEAGPKRVLTAFVKNILENKADSAALHSNHPKRGGLLEFHDLLAQLYVRGLDLSDPNGHFGTPQNRYVPSNVSETVRNDKKVVISGVAVGLPGLNGRMFDEDNFERIFKGENLIDSLPDEAVERQIAKNVTRISKQPDGAAAFEKVEHAGQTVRLAGQRGEFDPKSEFGLDHHVLEGSDVTSVMALCAGILALKDAGIPLVRQWRKSKTGKMLPKGWGLPDETGVETGIIFASAFPGVESLIEELGRHQSPSSSPDTVSLESLLEMYAESCRHMPEGEAKTRWTGWFAEKIRELQAAPARPVSSPVSQKDFSRAFLTRVLPMGHTVAAQFLKARGSSLHVNAACASTTAAIAVAEDWIRLGRVKRVLVISADNVTSPPMREWFLTGFLATGAATTEAEVEKAAVPFGRGRSGMVTGMGAAALVVEDLKEVEARGMMPLAEILATYFVNSALHPSRPDTEHIIESIGKTLNKFQERTGIKLEDAASRSIFFSHETFTHPVGGISTIEVDALRRAFGERFKEVLIANTKGFTGHPMGAGIEDVVAVRSLEAGKIPPIANFNDPDPNFSDARFSRGGRTDAEYAIRFAAGFGSQLAVSVIKKAVPTGSPRIADEKIYQAWLERISGTPGAQLEVVNNTLRVKGEVPSLPEASVPEAAAPQPKPVLAMTEEGVKQKVLEIIVAKTGYPVEMLELDLDMEADLGIDSVKQAEVFGQVRETFNIPRIEGVAIKDYPTLRHVLKFVQEQVGGVSSLEAPSAPVPPPVPSLPEVSVPEAAAPQPKPVLAMTEEGVKQKVLEIIVAKTGYPVEMLELDLDLEADLGIDSVKQAEIIGQVREAFDIPLIQGLAIKDYPTLRHVLNFVQERIGAPAVPVSSAIASPEAVPSLREAPSVFHRWAVSYVSAALEGERSGLAPKGLVILTPDTLGACNAFRSELTKRGFKTAMLPNDSWIWQEPAALEKAVEALRDKEGPIQGIVHTMALDLSFVLDFQKVTPRAWRNMWVKSIQSLFAVSKAARADVESMGPDGFVIAVSHPNHPLYGGVRGLVRSLRKELPAARVRSLAFDTLMSSIMAKTAWEELQYPKAGSEAAYKNGRRNVLSLSRRPLPEETESRWNKDSVFLITGGAQGVGAELAKGLALRYQPHLVLLGRTPLSPEAARWAEMSREELQNLRLQMWEQMNQREGRRVTPLEAEREFSKITRAAAIQRNVEEMKRAGAKPHYLACDVARWEDCERMLSFVREKISPSVHAVIHAAGLESSKLLQDKTEENFTEVFSVKADGAFNLVRLLAGQNVERWVFFSSITAKFGNAGQTDYSAANDFLNALAVDLSRWGQKAVSLGLTAWAEVGMAVRGGVESVLKTAGVDFLPPKAGVEMILEEMEKGSSTPEILLTGRIGALDEEGLLEGPSKSGHARIPVSSAETARRKQFLGRILSRENGRVTAGREFSLENDPYLADHQIGGVPYVPGVMGLEAFAHTVAAAGEPRPSLMRDVRFQLPIKLLRNKPATVRVEAVKSGSEFLLKIESDFITPQGFKLGEPRVHFTALSSQEMPEAAENQALPQFLAGNSIPREEIYAKYFHGPSFQVLERIASISPDEIWARYQAPRKPLWEKEPMSLITFPLLTEAAFQTAGYRDLHFEQTMTLPDSIAELVLYDAGSSAPQELWVRAKFLSKDSDGKSRYDVDVMDAGGRIWVRLRDYRMIPVGSI